jgi:hypothetical protein
LEKKYAEENPNAKPPTYEFLHCMAEGELPPDYGYGFSMATYFDSLSEENQKAFYKECKDIRSATMITRLITRYEAKENMDGWKEDRTKKYNREWKFKQKIKTSEKGLNEFSWDTFIHIPRIYLDEIKIRLDHLLNLPEGDSRKDHKLKLNEEKCASIGDELWKGVAAYGMELPSRKSNKAGETVSDRTYNRMTEKNLKDIGNAIMTFGDTNKSEGYFTSGKGADDRKRIFGRIMRPWGEATAAFGLHPESLEPITHALSSTTVDYATAKGGEQAIEKHMKALVADNEVPWCDMRASEAMWSQAANYDRYRNVVVTLYVALNYPQFLDRN